MYFGIDPGTRGAIVGLNDAGNIVFVKDIPLGKHGVDVRALSLIMHEIRGKGIDSLYVEEPFYKPADRTGEGGKRNMSIKNQRTAGVNSGIAYGMAMMVYTGTELVQPAIWRRGVGVPAGSGKEGSINLAMRVWPSCTKLTASKDGRADAALIAHYGYSHTRLIERNLDYERTR